MSIFDLQQSELHSLDTHTICCDLLSLNWPCAFGGGGGWWLVKWIATVQAPNVTLEEKYKTPISDGTTKGSQSVEEHLTPSAMNASSTSTHNLGHYYEDVVNRTWKMSLSRKVWFHCLPRQGTVWCLPWWASKAFNNEGICPYSKPEDTTGSKQW